MSSQETKVITFGCRLNSYESEVMRDHAQKNNLKNTIIINTCAVTNEAERQSRQAVRKAKRDNPSAKIIVTGCSAQINPSDYSEMQEVDMVLGNHEKMKASSFLEEAFNTEPVKVNDIMEIEETAHHLISGFDNKVRAFIQIQNGCDHRCTFCSIPFGRGNNRSVPLPEIIQQIKMLVANGCKEIVFTGVDITGYGTDLPGTPTLGQMTRRVLSQVKDLERLRLSSLDPVEIDDDLFDLIANEPRLMPHLHISLQAGDDVVLRRMKRRHLRHHVVEFCEKARSLRSDLVFGADIIAGFPTETEEMFENTYNLVKECDLTYLHIFPYSARKGTPASRMPQVKSHLIKERAARLREVGNAQKDKYYDGCVGKVVKVLIETSQTGHTEHYAPVELSQPLPQERIGHILSVKVIGHQNNKLQVELE